MNESKEWQRELSGKMTIVTCWCPVCHVVYSNPMPIEFTEDADVSKMEGKYPVICVMCRRKRQAHPVKQPDHPVKIDYSGTDLINAINNGWDSQSDGSK